MRTLEWLEHSHLLMFVYYRLEWVRQMLLGMHLFLFGVCVDSILSAIMFILCLILVSRVCALYK